MSFFDATMWLMEFYICAILTVEFWYDWKVNQHINNIKKRTRKKFEYEELNVGEHR